MFNKQRIATLIFINLIMAQVLCTTSFVIAQGGSWTTKKAMSTARTFLGAWVLDGKIYAIGGATGNSTSTYAVEMYDPITDTWTTKANMPSAHRLKMLLL